MVGEALRLAEQRLAEAGVDTPRVDAELLFAHVLGTSRTGVHERRTTTSLTSSTHCSNVGGSASRWHTSWASGVSEGWC